MSLNNNNFLLLPTKKCASSYALVALLLSWSCLSIDLQVTHASSLQIAAKRSFRTDLKQSEEETSPSSPSSSSTLPLCLPSASCGFVQLNGRGVSSLEFCRCPNRKSSCPLQWDPFDDRTIVHGNDHYKFCDRAPELHPCSPGSVVSTHEEDFSVTSQQPVVSHHRLHCVCPGNYMFVRNSSSFLEMEDQDLYRISVTYKCLPPPRCSLKESCMIVTETADSRFINRLCRCPRGTFCPRDLTLAESRQEMGRGEIFHMQCHS